MSAKAIHHRRSCQLIKDSNLSTEMIKHNDVYPDF